MKDRPIIFSAPMVHALLEGRKTQTRRIAKDTGTACRSSSGRTGLTYINPYGCVGDKLWVKEAWSTPPEWDDLKPSELNAAQLESICYHADGTRCGKTRSPLFMPRDASRIVLEIIQTRKERLQDINHADALAEGIHGPDAVADYGRLWDRLHGPGSWDSNPWVWVLTFRRIA